MSRLSPAVALVTALAIGAPAVRADFSDSQTAQPAAAAAPSPDASAIQAARQQRARLERELEEVNANRRRHQVKPMFNDDALNAKVAVAERRKYETILEEYRQAVSAEIVARTKGLDLAQQEKVVAEQFQQASGSQAEISRVATDNLVSRLSAATTPEDKAQIYSSIETTQTTLRIREEVAREARRRIDAANLRRQKPGAGRPRRGPQGPDTVRRMGELITRISNNYVEQAKLPSSRTGADGRRLSDTELEVELWQKQQQRDADLNEFVRLAESGILTDENGNPLSRELRDRIGKNAKLQLAETLRRQGIEPSLIRTLFGWSDSRTDLATQIENEVAGNNWYQVLDLIDSSTGGGTPQEVARALAGVIRFSADKVHEWRGKQIPEGGEGGVGGWLYEQFWAKQKVGAGTGIRIGTGELAAVDERIDAFEKDADAVVKALGAMAASNSPTELTTNDLKLLEAYGFVVKDASGKYVYTVPANADATGRLERNLDLPGATLMDVISGGSAIQTVLLLAAPQMAAARLGMLVQALGATERAVVVAEFVGNALVSAALDASIQKIQTGTVQWDRLVLDTVVLNAALPVAGALTGTVAGGLAEQIAKNPNTKKAVEGVLAQVLSLSGDTALLTYWQGKVAGTGMTFEDFLANAFNGVVMRGAPLVGRAAVGGIRSTVGGVRSIWELVRGASPELTAELAKGKTPAELADTVESARFQEQQKQFAEASKRLERAIGEEFLKMDLGDERLIAKVTEANETGQLGFKDLKAVFGEHAELLRLMEGVNKHKLELFDKIIGFAQTSARGAVQAEYAARKARFEDGLKGNEAELTRAQTDLENWRTEELRKIDIPPKAPGSKGVTSDIDRSNASTYLMNELKRRTDEVFRKNRPGAEPATSAKAYDVNEYYDIFQVINRMRAMNMDLSNVMLREPGVGLISQKDAIEAAGIAGNLKDLSPEQRADYRKNRTSESGDTARMGRLFDLAEQRLAQYEQLINAELAALGKQGLDTTNPDVLTRARDNVYRKQAADLAEMQAVLERLDVNSDGAKELAARIEREWQHVKMQGLEAYSNFAGLDIIVNKLQMNDITPREVLNGKADQAQTDKVNKTRAGNNQAPVSLAERQALIDKTIADIKTQYTPEQLRAALLDQTRFMIEHVNGYFEGHESATDAGTALSKYAERSVLLLTLAGTDMSTGPFKDLNNIAEILVKARGNPRDLRAALAAFGGGNADAGVRRLSGLLSETMPGLKGVFDAAKYADGDNAGARTANGAPRPAEGPGGPAANSAAVNALRRQRDADRERMQRVTGAMGVARHIAREKQDLEAELRELEGAKVEDARLASDFRRQDFEKVRDLESEQEALQTELDCLPAGQSGDVYRDLTKQLADSKETFEKLRGLKTAAGQEGQSDEEARRDRRIAVLKDRIGVADADITKFTKLAEGEEAVGTAGEGLLTGGPSMGLERISEEKISSTPELDKFGKMFLDDIERKVTTPAGGAATSAPTDLAPGNSASPEATAPTDVAPPNARPADAGADAVPATGSGGTLTIDPDGMLNIKPFGSTTTFPGAFGPDGGIQLYGPGTIIGPDSIPLFEAPPTPVPTGGMKVGPNGSVTFTGVDIGIPGDLGGPGAITPAGPGGLVFKPPKDDRKPGGVATGGAADTGVAVIGGGGGTPVETLPPGPGFEFGEREAFEPSKTTTTVIDEPIEDLTGGEEGEDLGGGGFTGDPGGCCTPGVQVLSLDFGEPATVHPTTQSRDDAALHFSLPWAARQLFAVLQSFARGSHPVASATTMAFANRSIGMPPAFTAPKLSQLDESEGGQQGRGTTPTTTAPNPLRTILTATGNSQGEAFDMQIINMGLKPLKIFGTGVVVEPIKRELQAQLRQQLAKVAGNNVLTRRVEAYCLQYALAPPSPGMLFQIAGPALQKQFKPAGMIMTAARQLGAAGALKPDSNPKSYLDSIKQYAIWTKFENWDQKKFGETLLDKTKQAAAAAKANWTGQMQTALLAAVPNRWRDIQTVLSAAQELAARPPQ